MRSTITLIVPLNQTLFALRREEMSQDLVEVKRQITQPAVAPYFPTEQDWNLMLRWAESALQSRLLPDSIKSKEAAAIIVLKGRELGLPFMVAIAHIHVIQGKPCMSAELIQALARRNLPGLTINIKHSDAQRCTIEFIRPEKGSTAFEMTFSMDDARQAGLLNKSSWKMYPSAMLFSRCVTAGLRKVCPEAMMGISYTPEEMGAEVDQEGNIIETTGKPVEPLKDPPKSEAPRPGDFTDQASTHLGSDLASEKEKVVGLIREKRLPVEAVVRFMTKNFGKQLISKLNLEEVKALYEAIQTNQCTAESVVNRTE